MESLIYVILISFALVAILQKFIVAIAIKATNSLSSSIKLIGNNQAVFTVVLKIFFRALLATVSIVSAYFIVQYLILPL